MKTIIYLFLIFFSWWGFFIYAIVDVLKILPDRWYIVLPSFAASVAWAFAVRKYAYNWRKKNNY